MSHYVHDTNAPACITTTTIPEGDVTYYAVFADKIDGTVWKKTEIDNIGLYQTVNIKYLDCENDEPVLPLYF